MRAIKFRAWDTFDKKMVYFSLGEGIRLHDRVITQFTGLLDKNGKEIYEGDILATYEGEEMGWYSAGQVYWWEDSASFILADKETYMSEDEYADDPQEWNDYEVIGNIYETPELLY